MKKRLLIIIIPTLAISNFTTVFAQKKVYVAERTNPEPPVIDGVLDDPAWGNADWDDNFMQYIPYEKTEPTEKTTFKVMYDEKNLYIGIYAYDKEPSKIVRRLARRDEGRNDSDFISISIDSYHDYRTAYQFAINASGGKTDIAFYEAGKVHDKSWNPVWYVDTSVDESGWTAEMRIPFSQLRFPNREEQIWGMQVIRCIHRKQEYIQWQVIPKDSPGWIHLMGELRGIKGISSPIRVELLPYTTGKVESDRKEEGNPFAPGLTTGLGLGLDGKVGLTGNLTLDFTINPDFGQVEADPSVVNLTSFETFYEEKRPFFIEGKNLFDYRTREGRSQGLFYSRRIGRPPHYYPGIESDEFQKIPVNTSILGAFKLTGKTQTGWSIGVLEAVTTEEESEIASGQQCRRIVVEPRTNYTVGSLRKDFHQGNTIIGGMVTAVNRNIQDSHLEFLPRAAYAGGLEFLHQWKDKTYFVNLKSSFSHVRGSSEAILNVQTSNCRLFQRPDAKHVTLDSARTFLSGYSGFFQIGRAGQGRWLYDVNLYWNSPGFEINDLGFMSSTDRIQQASNLRYRVLEPIGIFRRFTIRLRQFQGWNFGGERTFFAGSLSTQGQFKNFWEWSAGLTTGGDWWLNQYNLRGGPAMMYPGDWRLRCTVFSDPRKKLQLTLSGYYLWYSYGPSRLIEFSPGITYRPSNAVSLILQPTFSTNVNNEQYIETIDKDNDSRYILARLEQKTLGIVLRLNYSITPSLSIQYYGQPFLSSQKFSEFKRVTNPRAKSYNGRFHAFSENEMTYDAGEGSYIIDENADGTEDYTIGNPDFNVRELHSNLVIRWEYRPGSTVYLVWSQVRTGSEQTGYFSFADDWKGLFNIYPHNIVMVKLSHWFSL